MINLSGIIQGNLLCEELIVSTLACEHLYYYQTMKNLNSSLHSTVLRTSNISDKIQYQSSISTQEH